MKYANKVNAVYTMILGEDEIANNTASLKKMESGEQIEVKLSAEEIFASIK